MNIPLTVLIVPGLRDAVEQHWQTLLAARLPGARTVPPMGREDIDCAARVAALEREACAIAGPLLIVAHSGGCITVAHWARSTKRAVRAALMATPPDFETALPDGYPTLKALDAAGWLPVPRTRLPFRSLVAASRNDPLARFERAEQLARDWGSELVDLGAVGHLNPASGYGAWPQAEALITRLSAAH
jgi:predicted alpha/beta hydrolase family esterase